MHCVHVWKLRCHHASFVWTFYASCLHFHSFMHASYMYIDASFLFLFFVVVFVFCFSGEGGLWGVGGVFLSLFLFHQ